VKIVCDPSFAPGLAEKAYNPLGKGSEKGKE